MWQEGDRLGDPLAHRAHFRRCFFEHHLISTLVLTQSGNRCMADQPFGGRGAEFDLGDQLRPDEAGTPGVIGRKLFVQKGFLGMAIASRRSCPSKDQWRYLGESAGKIATM